MSIWLLMAIISVSFLVGAGFVSVAVICVFFIPAVIRVKRNNDKLAKKRAGTLTRENMEDMFRRIGGDNIEN